MTGLAEDRLLLAVLFYDDGRGGERGGEEGKGGEGWGRKDSERE